MVSQDEAERALRWLATTDTEMADWIVQVMRAEFMVETAEALVYASLEGPVEDRKKAAKASPEYAKAKEAVFAAVRGKERLRAQRKSAEMLIESWRSLNANRRVANVT